MVYFNICHILKYISSLKSMGQNPGIPWDFHFGLLFFKRSLQLGAVLQKIWCGLEFTGSPLPIPTGRQRQQKSQSFSRNSPVMVIGPLAHQLWDRKHWAFTRFFLAPLPRTSRSQELRLRQCSLSSIDILTALRTSHRLQTLDLEVGMRRYE